MARRDLVSFWEVCVCDVCVGRKEGRRKGKGGGGSDDVLRCGWGGVRVCKR